MSKQAKSVLIKIPCGNCGGAERNHEVLYEHETDWYDEDSGEQGGTTHQMCKCRGCDDICFRQDSWDTFDRDQETGEPDRHVTIYPSLTTSDRKPIETDELPDKVSHIYVETVSAFNAGALTLAGGGLRAIVEAICIDQNVSGRNLLEKIDDLVKKEMLAKPQAKLLHEERYIGNAALHEILLLPKQEVAEGLTIIEGLLNTIYVLPLRAERLRRKREKRNSKK